MAERFVSEPDSPVRPALLKLLDDPDWNVQQQLAASLGAMPAGSREVAIAGVLERHGDKPVVMDAALSGTRGVELGVLREILQSTTRTPQRETAITMLAGTLVRGALDASIQSLFQMIGDDARPAWQRSDLLRGSEVALLGTPMPGTPARGRGAARRRMLRVRPAPAAARARAVRTHSPRSRRRVAEMATLDVACA